MKSEECIFVIFQILQLFVKATHFNAKILFCIIKKFFWPLPTHVVVTTCGPDARAFLPCVFTMPNMMLISQASKRCGL